MLAGRAPLLLAVWRCAAALDQPEVRLPCGRVRGLWESPVWEQQDGSGGSDDSSSGRSSSSSGSATVDKPSVADKPTLAAFRGIPYGTAPTGARRWKPATAAGCWPTGTALNATTDGPTCMQGSGDEGGMSEDCLSLNVFVPSTHLGADADGRRRPFCFFCF